MINNILNNKDKKTMTLQGERYFICYAYKISFGQRTRRAKRTRINIPPFINFIYLNKYLLSIVYV
jgi:hypothetical protein